MWRCRELNDLTRKEGLAGSGQTAAEEHGGMLDEAVEDLGDEKGGEEVDQQETAHGNSTEEGVDQNEESGSVNEIEAVGDLAEVVDGPRG